MQIRTCDFDFLVGDVVSDDRIIALMITVSPIALLLTASVIVNRLSGLQNSLTLDRISAEKMNEKIVFVILFVIQTLNGTVIRMILHTYC